MKTNFIFGKRYLIISDFDGTLFDTSHPSPTGITVYKAYTKSLDDIFGEGAGDWFFSVNGFRGEAPSQIIKTFLSMSNRHYVDLAKKMHQEQNGNFPRIIPESQNGTIIWHCEEPERTLTSMLVLKKLTYLIREIGTLNEDGKPWPLPCEGVLDFFSSLKTTKEENLPVDFAIVSSGHESFIRKALSTWNIPHPDILITEDDLRQRQFPTDSELKFKPGVFPIALAHFQWLKSQRISVSKEVGHETRTRIMHIGDTLEKDLVMAEKAGITCNLLYPNTSWKDITQAIKNRDLFDGRPFAEILNMQSIGTENLNRNGIRGKERI